MRTASGPAPEELKNREHSIVCVAIPAGLCLASMMHASGPVNRHGRVRPIQTHCRSNASTRVDLNVPAARAPAIRRLQVGAQWPRRRRRRRRLAGGGKEAHENRQSKTGQSYPPTLNRFRSSASSSSKQLFGLTFFRKATYLARHCVETAARQQTAARRRRGKGYWRAAHSSVWNLVSSDEIRRPCGSGCSLRSS